MAKKKTKKDIEKEKRISKKKQKESEEKILKGILIGAGIVFGFILLYMIISYNSSNFEYRGVEFQRIQEGDLTFYKTGFPVVSNGQMINYNIFIRNDPRVLENEVPFNGEISLYENAVIDSTSDFNCDGYGVISIANLQKLSIFGVNLVRDENFTCNPGAEYSHLLLQESNESSVVQTAPSCYELNINNCEILKVTERFMVETFVKVKESEN